MITNGLQNALSSMGIKNRGDGWFDTPTVDALYRISGPEWKSKAWVQVIGDVRQAKASGIPAQRGNQAMGYYEDLGAFTDTGGVCKPSDLASCHLFSELQNQLNRVLKAHGQKEIRVDGEIGPGTVGAISRVYALTPSFSKLPAGTCAQAADNAFGLTSSFQKMATIAGAPPRPLAQCKTRRIIKTPTGLEEMQFDVKAEGAEQAGFAQVIMDNPLIAGAVIGGALLLWQFQTKGKRK
jgi:hypothetical protein